MLKPNEAEHSRSTECSSSQDVTVPTEPGLYWVVLRSPVSGNLSKPAIVVVTGNSPYLSMTKLYPCLEKDVNAYYVVASQPIIRPESI